MHGNWIEYISSPCTRPDVANDVLLYMGFWYVYKILHPNARWHGVPVECGFAAGAACAILNAITHVCRVYVMCSLLWNCWMKIKCVLPYMGWLRMQCMLWTGHASCFWVQLHPPSTMLVATIRVCWYWKRNSMHAVDRRLMRWPVAPNVSFMRNAPSFYACILFVFTSHTINDRKMLTYKRKN